MLPEPSCKWSVNKTLCGLRQMITAGRPGQRRIPVKFTESPLAVVSDNRTPGAPGISARNRAFSINIHNCRRLCCEMGLMQ